MLISNHNENSKCRGTTRQTVITWDRLDDILKKKKKKEYINVCGQMLSHVQLFGTPWIIACQTHLFMGFSRQEYWSGVPFPSPGNLPYPGIEPASLMSPALAGGFFTTSTTWKAQYTNKYIVFLYRVIFPGGWDSKESACNAGDPGLVLSQEDSLEEGMATLSNILAWRIPWTEKSGGLQSIGWQSQTWLKQLSTHTYMYVMKWFPHTS